MIISLNRLLGITVVVSLFAVSVRAADTGISREQADRIIAELAQIRALLGRQVGAAPQTGRPDPAVKLDLKGSLIMGSPTAPVTLVEFTDYQCPFCNKFYRDVFSNIKTNFIYTGKVRFYSRDLPLDIHPNALQAAPPGVVRPNRISSGHSGNA
jgi:protein-disulfide isomerase